MIYFGNSKKSTIFHILDNNNNNICKNSRMLNIIQYDNFTNQNN